MNPYFLISNYWREAVDERFKQIDHAALTILAAWCTTFSDDNELDQDIVVRFAYDIAEAMVKESDRRRKLALLAMKANDHL